MTGSEDRTGVSSCREGRGTTSSKQYGFGSRHEHHLVPVVSPSNEVGGLAVEIEDFQHLTTPMNRPMCSHEDLVTHSSVHGTSDYSPLWTPALSSDELMNARVQMP
jgi:hypothetical protein